jgi:hypothetical protein
MVGMLAGAWLAGLTVRAATVDGAVARRMVLAAAITCAATIGVGSVGGPWWIVPFYLVGGAGNAAINVCGGTLMGRRVPADARGRAATAMGMRVQAGSILGYVGGALLLTVAEPRWIVLGCGFAGLATALAVLPFLARAGSGATPLAPLGTPPAIAAGVDL